MKDKGDYSGIRFTDSVGLLAKLISIETLLYIPKNFSH